MSEQAGAKSAGGLSTWVVLAATFFATSAVVLLVGMILPRPAPGDGVGRHYREDFPDEDSPADHLSSVERDLGVTDQPGEVPTRPKNPE